MFGEWIQKKGANTEQYVISYKSIWFLGEFRDMLPREVFQFQ